jgi:hypothetical protein
VLFFKGSSSALPKEIIKDITKRLEKRFIGNSRASEPNDSGYLIANWLEVAPIPKNKKWLYLKCFK